MAEQLTMEQWKEKGRKLYGDDIMNWKFKCPVCGNIQTPLDFKPYKDKGAAPDHAAHCCIGRFSGTGRTAFGESKESEPDSPCDYTCYGLLTLHTYEVESEEGGKPLRSFAFADDKKEDGQEAT